MSGLSCWGRLQVLSPGRINAGHNHTQLAFLFQNIQFVVARSFSLAEATRSSDKHQDLGQKPAFLLSYLVNSCGLSLRSAKSICKKIVSDSDCDPVSVIDLLKTHGFKDAQITRVVQAFPRVLASDHQTDILPKLEFLQSIGLSSDDTVQLISSCPKVLSKSLDNHIIPVYDFLKSLLACEQVAVKVLKNTPWILYIGSEKNLDCKVTVLRKFGVQDRHISLLLKSFTRLFMVNPEKFEANVKKIVSLEFDPLGINFIHALRVVSQLNKSTWERKINAYKEWGFPEDEIEFAFKRHPLCMAVSEKKISATLDFLVNKMGFESSEFAKYPQLLLFSLEKRIIPRYSVIANLLSKGILRKGDVGGSYIMSMSDERFLHQFVLKNLGQVPELLDVFHMKAGVQILASRHEDAIGTKS